MNTQDKVQLQRWVAGKASYNEVLHTSPVGLVGNLRFTGTAKRAFFLLWTWGAVRLSSAAQDRYVARCGAPALLRRIERARRIAARIAAGDF